MMSFFLASKDVLPVALIKPCMMNGFWNRKCRLPCISVCLELFQLDTDAAGILNELQQKLNGVLDDLSAIFAKRYLNLVYVSLNSMNPIK